MNIKFIEFFRQVGKESAKITWADKNETIKSALVVVVAVALASLFFLTIDVVVYKVVHFLLELGR